MIELLRRVLPLQKIEACVMETNTAVIEIFDCYDCAGAEKRSYVRSAPDQPVHFTLHNKGNITIWFAAIDNCIFGPADAARCDCIAGNASKIYFIEIKRANVSQRRKAREEAIQQLHATISYFSSYMQAPLPVLIAVICLKAKRSYPVQNATRGAERVAFKEKYNADLLEGQSADF